MSRFTEVLNQFRDRVFSNIHSNNLIYNTCWEDPRCDREMLQFHSDSKVVMITSAGCNALDYLLDNPQAIHTIDVNPRQNALLALKIAAIQAGNYADLWKYFGEGYHADAVGVYAQHLRPLLPEYAREFWDKNIVFFTKKSFYFFGTSGTFAWLVGKYIDARPKLRQAVTQLLEASSLEEQTRLYAEIEPKILPKFIQWGLNRHLTMSMLGVPRAQRDLIVEDYPQDKVAGFIRDALRHIFTELPTADNYFWRLYLTGKYTPQCAPNYLLPTHFAALRERASHIHQHTTTVAQFLEANPDKYSHYILLDHQDWLASHNVEALVEEWNLILKNSKKGTKILLRSAALRVDFFPDFVREAVVWDEATMQRLHRQDRVGTYGSVYVGTVR